MSFFPSINFRKIFYSFLLCWEITELRKESIKVIFTAIFSKRKISLNFSGEYAEKKERIKLNTLEKFREHKFSWMGLTRKFSQILESSRKFLLLNIHP